MTIVGLDPQEMKAQKLLLESSSKTDNWLSEHLSCHGKFYTQIFAFCVKPLQISALKVPVIPLPTTLHMWWGPSITVCGYYRKLPHHNNLDLMELHGVRLRVDLTLLENSKRLDYIQLCTRCFCLHSFHLSFPSLHLCPNSPLLRYGIWSAGTEKRGHLVKILV